MQLIGDVAGFGALNGIEVSLCGDAAAIRRSCRCCFGQACAASRSRRPMLGAVKAAIARTRLHE